MKPAVQSLGYPLPRICIHDRYSLEMGNTVVPTKEISNRDFNTGAHD